MDRIVRQIHPEELQHQGSAEQRLGAFLAKPNIVLLGDPGAGKSHAFREMAAACGGRYVTARAFLAIPVRNTGDDLFIDGLDERRAGRRDRDTVDALAAKLIEADPRALRTSCRVADWLGKSDLVSLEPFFEERGGVVVLTLGPLTPGERRAVLTNNGMSPSNADALLREGEERGLGEFLDNPQNLLLLRRVVQTGAWPATRRDLFEMATRLMLQEENSERARAGSGVFTSEELRLPAGAALAARLISDVEAISLADQEGTETIPSYRTLPFFEPSKSIAALSRRVFAAGPAPESVDYFHRTTAEYLGAAWLAQAVRAGLPIGRVVALMGVDGHPAPELRGLHAWLTVHLPEHAERLIDADPYGVLTYGDAASLSQTLCARLVRALGQLSRTDPWFRSGNYGSPAIAGLARADTVDEFRAVLRSPDAGFGIRGIVLEAAALGAPLPALRDDLVRVLETGTLPYAQRLYALVALLRLGEDGKASVLHAGRTVFATDLASLRLRAEAIRRLYGDPFGPSDVARLMDDILSSPDEVDVGVLWNLPSTLPLADLPATLDAMQISASDVDDGRRNVREIAAFFYRVLLRVLEAPDPIDPTRLLAWLQKRRVLAGTYSGSNGSELKRALRAHPARIEGVLLHFLESFVPDNYGWLKLSRFREAVFFEIGHEQLIDGMLRAMAAEPAGSPRELFFYEAAFALSYEATDSQRAFDRIYELADNRPDLAAVRMRSVSCEIPEGHRDMRGRQEEAHKAARSNDIDRVRREFARDAAAVASGAHLNGLIWAARIYLGIFPDVDHAAASEARFVPILDDPYAAMALDGLVAALSRTDVPTLQDVIDLAVQRQYKNAWHVYIAGLNERFRRTSSLEGTPDELLRAMLAFDLTSPMAEDDGHAITTAQHPWKQALLRERPGLVRHAYEAVARAKLARGEEHPDGMRELLTHEALAAFREDAALGLLRDFPNANAFPLHELLMAALGMPSAHTALLALANRVLSDAMPIDQPQRDLWLMTAWLLSPNHHGTDLQGAAQSRPEIVFDLRDFTGHSRNEAAPGLTPSLGQIEFLIRLAGSLYPPTGYPNFVWGGDRNSWDAADYVRGLVNHLSANGTEAATDALLRLESDASLAAYRPEIQHALANQRARRREAEYDRPDWPRTVRALNNQQPATVADFHAILFEHLDELRKRIRTENTDIYRMFWNLDGHGHLESPRPEEACRDDLVTLLRPRLAPLGISLEPEGHMAGDRRADISASMPARKILCEIKRDYHPDLWTAPDAQLERFYAHDPEALGFGIYLVFWFGDGRPAMIRLPPHGQPRPTSAEDMESMLRARFPPDRAARTAVIVIDVTKPD
jgi:hypothetical protein